MLSDTYNLCHKAESNRHHPFISAAIFLCPVSLCSGFIVLLLRWFVGTFALGILFSFFQMFSSSTHALVFLLAAF